MSLPNTKHTAVTSSQKIRTEKSLRNIIRLSRNQIVSTIFRLIWNRMGDCLIPNQSENGKYNMISIWFNKISVRFARTCTPVFYRRGAMYIFKHSYFLGKYWDNPSHIWNTNINAIFIFQLWNFNGETCKC